MNALALIAQVVLGSRQFIRREPFRVFHTFSELPEGLPEAFRGKYTPARFRFTSKGRSAKATTFARPSESRISPALNRVQRLKSFRGLLQVGMSKRASAVSVVTARHKASCWNPGYEERLGVSNGS
jgi:hypothetical protein